jgi:hypothetical protein
MHLCLLSKHMTSMLRAVLCCAHQGRLQVTWPTTPLIVAAKMGHPDMVALLMERGATIAGLSKVGQA